MAHNSNAIGLPFLCISKIFRSENLEYLYAILGPVRFNTKSNAEAKSFGGSLHSSLSV